jgi:hypothetical protein
MMNSVSTSSPLRVAPSKTFRRNDDPAQVPVIERESRGRFAGARFDLDEGERAPAPRDDVELAAGHAGATGKDTPALEP